MHVHGNIDWRTQDGGWICMKMGIFIDFGMRLAGSVHFNDAVYIPLAQNAVSMPPSLLQVGEWSTVVLYNGRSVRICGKPLVVCVRSSILTNV